MDFDQIKNTVFLKDDVVRQYTDSTKTTYDDATVEYAHPNGALDVRCIKTGKKWGWSSRMCTLIKRNN